MVVGGSSGAQVHQPRAVARAALPALNHRFSGAAPLRRGQLDTNLEGTANYCQKEYLTEETREMTPRLRGGGLDRLPRGLQHAVGDFAAAKAVAAHPYPRTASRATDHERALLRGAGAGRVLYQEDMTPDTLRAQVVDFYKDRGSLIDAMEKRASANGLKNVLKSIRRITRNSRGSNARPRAGARVGTRSAPCPCHGEMIRSERALRPALPHI
jgi:hypothetical protein